MKLMPRKAATRRIAPPRPSSLRVVPETLGNGTVDLVERIVVDAIWRHDVRRVAKRTEEHVLLLEELHPTRCQVRQVSPRECLPRRQVESSLTRSPASGLVLATPLVVTPRLSSVWLGASQIGCSTAFSPAVSSRIFPKLHQQREHIGSDAVARSQCAADRPCG